MSHECQITDLHRIPRPAAPPDGNCVGFPVVCTVCQRKFEEIYDRRNGLWDPVKLETVFLDNDAIPERG